MVEDPHRVADPFDVLEDVRAHEDGGRILQVADQLQHVPPSPRVESAHRLIQEKDLWAVHQRLGQAQALAHPAAEATDASPGRIFQPNPVQQLGCPGTRLPALQSEQPGDIVGQELLGRHPGIEVRFLGQVPDQRPRPALRADRVARHPGPTTGRVGQASQNTERGGLACTIRAEKAEDRARLHRQVEPVQGLHGTIRLAEALDA